jgi:hypothetical protein
MVRCLLSALLVLPLLLPQGVCLCHILDGGEAAHTEAGDAADDREPGSHRHCPSDPGHDHADGCPCVIPDYLARQAPNPPLALPLVDSVVLPAAGYAVPGAGNALTLHLLIPLDLSSPPLYLRVRALLI